MPLEKKASKKAFIHNLKAEMHADKPKDQSLAIAYSVQRKAKKKKASGGTVESGSKDMNYADGGGVHSKTPFQLSSGKNPQNYPQESEREGMSAAGHEARLGLTASAKKRHKETLEELRAMPNPRLRGLAEGGKVDHNKEASKHSETAMNYHDSIERFGDSGQAKERDYHDNMALHHSARAQGDEKAAGRHLDNALKSRGTYAEGGVVSAKTEKRPMPDQTTDSTKMTSENANKKELYDSNWTDRPDKKQTQGAGMKTTKIKHPKMVASDRLQVRLRDEEDDLESSAAPASPDKQPPESDNEEGPNRQGKSPTKQSSISTGRQVMAEGGEAGRNAPGPAERMFGGQKGVHEPIPKYKKHEGMKYGESELPMLNPSNKKAAVRERTEESKSIKPKLQGLAEGGKVESSDYDDTDPNAATDSDMHLDPSEDEAAEMARHHDEEYQRQTSGNPDYSKPHSEDIDTYMYADGGEAEMEDEEHDSIAAAVMARMERAKAQIASGNRDMDAAARFAEGGKVDIDDNNNEEPNEYPPMNGDALDHNMNDDFSDMEQPEDSNETGDEREDDRSDPQDMVDSIRRKMKNKRSFSDN